MTKPKNLGPGDIAPASGQYMRIGPRGGEGPEITAVKGKRLPPTPKPGMGYVLVDRTNNESGRGK